MMAILFDSSDRKLLARLEQNSAARLFNYHLHPRGIKELVDQRSLRVATLMENLLDTLEEGKTDERLEALHSLRDEVFFSTGTGMHKNSARVLLSIMKDLLREQKSGDERRALELAHDFHSVIRGNPLIIRRFLRKYHLLEMPEEWNQITFDHHVHDAHTKGRKSPSHLIMDAWIKGIRKLTVIYYEFVPYEAAYELLSAARIMQVDLRIGVELTTRFRNGTARLIWTPRGFSGEKDFLSFLKRKRVKAFMKDGKARMSERSRGVLSAFEEFSERELAPFCHEIGIDPPVLKQKNLHDFVGTGQLSCLHVAEFLHDAIFPLMNARVTELRHEREALPIDDTRSTEIDEHIRRFDHITSESIYHRFFKDLDHVSEIDTLATPRDTIEQLTDLHPGYRITLGLQDLDLKDVYEIIFQCEGRISHLETFNQKDYSEGLLEHIPEIQRFKQALNDGNTILVKRMIISMINDLRESEHADDRSRAELFESTLPRLPALMSWYSKQKLRDRWGSDSTGRYSSLFGMGFALCETLPQKARREIRRWNRIESRIMPFHIRVTKIIRLPAAGLFRRGRKEWESDVCSVDRPGRNNVVTLGGKVGRAENGFVHGPSPRRETTPLWYWDYLNTDIKNALKVLVGFIPAFLTFFLTKDWWVLAYLGAPIWFGITGIRNVLQSVLGGDSFRRSPLLHWKTYVNWSRISDSLFFTGFSVPLLDFLVKQLVLDRGFGINTSTNVFALYAFMGLVNGIYISSHNFLRGLPPAAILGNFFRSILSIPVAIAFNNVIGAVLKAFAVPDIAGILQKWAAIISKAASDSVAGVIEGTADRNRYIRLRKEDYERKLDQMYSSYSRMEFLLPDEEVLRSMEKPKKVIRMIRGEDEELLRTIIYDALDLLYFWMYQPHARTVLRKMIRGLLPEDRVVFQRFQNVLRRRKLITTLFVEGLLGHRYEKALAFYLDRSKPYLHAIQRIAGKSPEQIA